MARVIVAVLEIELVLATLLGGGGGKKKKKPETEPDQPAPAPAAEAGEFRVTENGAEAATLALKAAKLAQESDPKSSEAKQALGFAVNLAAAIYFAFSGKVEWMVAFVMIFGSLSGGLIGGTLAGKIKPELLRWIVVDTPQWIWK